MSAFMRMTWPLKRSFLFEENYARPSHGVPIPDEGLWRTTYDEVLNEPDQEMWRKLSSSILAGKLVIEHETGGMRTLLAMCVLSVFFREITVDNQ